MTVFMNATPPPALDGALYAGGIDMADVAFALAAYQITSLDADLALRLDTIKHVTALKDAYRERIAALQEALRNVDGDGKVWLDGEYAGQVEFAWDGGSGTVVGADGGAISDGAIRVVRPDGTGADLEATGLEGLEQAKRIMRDYDPEYDHFEVQVSREDIETEIARLQGKLDELSGTGEIELLAINSLLGKRSQALQLASNIMSSSNAAAMGIIANLK